MMFYSSTIMLELNVKKIERERRRLGLRKSELARKMGISRQLLHYTLRKKQFFHIDKFAKVFDLDEKDLIR